MSTTLQVRLSAREMARLVDGEAVEIRTNDRTVVLTAPPPDWEDPEARADLHEARMMTEGTPEHAAAYGEPDVEAREAQAAYDDEWVGRRS